MQRKSKVIFLFLFLISGFSLAQDYVFLENELTEKTELYYANNHDFHFFPNVKTYFISDSAKKEVYGDSKWKLYLSKENKKFKYSILPLINVSGGISSEDSTIAIGQLGLGIAFNSNLMDKLYFSISAYFEEGVFPGYQSNYYKQADVVSGMGRLYEGAFGNNFTRFDALLSYRPYDFLALEAGIGKHFIGEGYRSFFVSDLASNAPFGRLNVNIWRLNFSATYSMLTHRAPGSGPEWPEYRKYTARHYLSLNATKWLRLGFFESVVWQATNGDNYRGFDVHYINPIQFYRPVEYSIGSADNSLLGFDLNFIFKKWTLYGQIMLDEFLLREVTAGDGWWANKYAIQVGLKAMEPFSFKNSFLRLEFNLARPFTFSHGSPKQNYAHLGEAIAHPLGSNFYEGLVEFNFDLGKRSRIETLFLAYLKGEDPPGENMGGDIFKSYSNPANQYGNYIGQGDQRKVFMAQLQYSYLLSDENRLKLLGGLRFRNENYLATSSFSTQVYVGISTTIWSRYTAF